MGGGGAPNMISDPGRHKPSRHQSTLANVTQSTSCRSL